jgi:peptidyl-prolyl cis-trans isomerase D
MFDLFRSRDKAVRILLGAILLAVSLSMLTYLIPNYGSGVADTGDNVVAEVGDSVITLPDVQKVVQQVTRGRQVPSAVLAAYVPRIVDDLVIQRALAYQAGKLGFQVTDAQMTEAIRQMIPSLFQDGKFVGTEAYTAMLAQQNTTISEFETDLRRQMLTSRLRNMIVDGIVVTPAEIEQAYRRKGEKVKVEYVKLTADKYRKDVQPTVAEEQEYFKANATKYQTPEQKALNVLIADPAKIAATLNPSDTDLEKVYNQNRESFRVPERVKVRHILLKTTEKPAADEPKIKAKAEDLLKQIRAGANFADLAKKNSEDAASANAKNPGELPDWVTKGQTVPEFEKAAFSLKPGQTSDLVKTQYGYHIIQVLAHEDAHLRTFQEVKSELAEAWKKQRVNELMQNVIDQAQAALQKDPAHPEKVAAQFNMQSMAVANFQSGTPLPEVGSSPDFDQAIVPLKQGEVSQPVALQDNKVAIAVVTGVTPAHPAKFEDVQAQIANEIVQNRLTNIVQQRAQELFNAAKNEGDLAKAAKAAGLDVKTSAEFDRAGTVEGVGAASYLESAFTRPDNSIIGPVQVPDGTVVAKVVQHIPADMAGLAAQRAAIRDEVKNKKARDRDALFSESVRQELVKKGKIKVHEPVIKRLITSYNTAG